MKERKFLKKENKQTQKKPEAWRKKALISACVVLSVILVVLIAATIYFESVFGLINRTDGSGDFLTLEEYLAGETDDLGFTGPTKDPDDVDWGDAADAIGNSKNIINILLIGQDRREGEGRSRSDAMILCTINKAQKSLTMSSFMRDMYVQIPGYSDNRINASYAMGGMELLDDCLKKNFGVEVDGNVEVDFSGFKDVIDILGGVEIELTAAEAQYLNRRGNWEVDDNAWEWSLSEGVNSLNGSQALAYSRVRNVGNGDFGRTNRQRTVLNALIEKTKTMSVSQLNDLLKEVLPLLTTDLTDAEIMGYALNLFPLLSDLEIKTQQIPAEGTYEMTRISGMSVLVPDLVENREVLKEIMAE